VIAVDALAANVSPVGVRVQVEFEFGPGQAVDAIAGGNPASPQHCRVICAKPPRSGQKGEAGLQFLAPDFCLTRKVD